MPEVSASQRVQASLARLDGAAFGANLAHALSASLDLERFLALRLDRAGDPFRVAFPGLGETWLTSHPEGARTLFQADPSSLSPPRPNPVEPLLGDRSLILLDGPRHLRERKLLMPTFMGERMRGHADVIQRETLAALDEMPEHEPRSLVGVTQAITLRVIVRVVFGIAEPERRARYEKLVGALLDAYTPLLVLVPWLRHAPLGLGPWARLQTSKANLDASLREDIAKKRAETGANDVLSLLMAARHEDGSALSLEDLLDELRTLLAAGHETTASSIAWTMYRLHREPHVLARLREELAPLGQRPDPAKLLSLPYLGAVCQETLRLHPVVPVVLRQLASPLSLVGRHVPRGATAGVAVRLLHVHPEVWHRPDDFEPARFLARKYTPFEYAPFGGGHRRCLGAAFATQEMRVVVGTLLADSSFALCEPDRTGPLPQVVPQGITVVPRRAPRFRRKACLDGPHAR